MYLKIRNNRKMKKNIFKKGRGKMKKWKNL